MNRPAVVVPLVITINACIWAFTIIMCSYTLRGTGAYQQIQNILAGGTIASIITVGGGLGGLAKMLKRQD
jgi:hypothetical protein